MIIERGYTIGKRDEVKGTGGWFVGFFMESKGFPSLATEDFEMAVMDLPLEDSNRPHFHKIATETTYVISGRLTLNFGSKESGITTVEVGMDEFFIVKPGTILQNPKNEPGTKVLVVKVPSVQGDKYYIE